MTRLIVHIGGAKCGSTAIQSFLRNNRDSLAEQSFIAANTDLTSDMGHQADQVWFFQRLAEDAEATSGNHEASVRKAAGLLKSRLNGVLRKHRKRRRSSWFSKPSACTILLSAENLSNQNGLHEVFGLLERYFEVELVLYIRRQEDMFMSGWQQWFAKVEDDLDAWIPKTSGFFCDWKQTIESWESVHPRKFDIRLFDRSSLTNGDVKTDYCGLVGLDPANFHIAEGDTNVTHGSHIARLMHDCREMYENNTHDTYFEHLLFRLDITAAAKRPNEVIFTPSQLRAIRARYAEDNAWIRARYFPDLPRKDLFPELDYSKLSYPDQSEINDRNRQVIHQILQKVPIGLCDLPAIDEAATPDVMRAQIAAATIDLVQRLKRDGYEV